MANYGTVEFRSARASGIFIHQLGSGTADHLGFFGAAGVNQSLTVNEYNDTTFITDELGNVPTYLGEASGELRNCKYIDGSTVEVSGAQITITNLNVFHVDNLDTAPHFINSVSGTLLIRYLASGVSEVHTYNARLWAYDRDAGDHVSAPTDVAVLGFEINASGEWYNTAQSGVWNSMDGYTSSLYFADHSPRNGYLAAHEHIWVAGITVRPEAVGALDFGLGFTVQYV